jgi:outer membrane autotransporter protein
VTGTTPFAVSGNRAAAIDPTPFAMADRTLLDFSRAVSSAMPDIEGSFTATAAAGSGSALAFAGPATNASLGENSLPGLSAYADNSNLPFKSPTVVYGNGTALWARAFVGERVQDADGALLETHNRFYGGLLGGGWQVRPNLRLGLFAGAGETRSTIDTYGETESTLVFAGLTGRYNWGASFLRFGLQGGHSSNDTTRSHINNNLVPGGLETATASFDGWYLTPEATFGHRFALGSVGGGAYTLTPSFTVRYLHASFDGYTETGTTAPLTVGDRTVDSFEERGQLKLTRTQVFAPAKVLKTSLFGGVLADQRVGGDSIDAVLLGQAIPFATPGDDSVWGGFAGAGLEWRTGRVTLFASAEYLALSDSSSVISGQGGLRVAF